MTISNTYEPFLCNCINENLRYIEKLFADLFLHLLYLDGKRVKLKLALLNIPNRGVKTQKQAARYKNILSMLYFVLGMLYLVLYLL